MPPHLVENYLSDGQVRIEVFDNRLTAPDLLIIIVGICWCVRHSVSRQTLCVWYGQISTVSDSQLQSLFIVAAIQ